MEVEFRNLGVWESSDAIAMFFGANEETYWGVVGVDDAFEVVYVMVIEIGWVLMGVGWDWIF